MFQFTLFIVHFEKKSYLCTLKKFTQINYSYE